MRLSASLRVASLVIMSVLGSASAVAAADLGAVFGPGPEPTADQPLEFGTGWYLRGDGAFSIEDHPQLDSVRGQFNRDKTQDGYGFGLGAGYKWNSFLRTDVTADYLDRYDYSNRTFCGRACEQDTHDNVYRVAALGNAYVDLGNWSGITPYVGAGAGVGAFHQVVSVDTSNGLDSDFKRTQYRFAWAAMAGFSYSITPNLMLDIGYRYLDLGRLKVAAPSLPSLDKDITAQQVRVGLRYAID